MEITEKRIKGVFELKGKPNLDFRGFMVRTYEREEVVAAHIDR